MKKYGTRSTRNLKTAHPDLQKIFNLAITRSNVDFSITEGERSIKRQKKLYEAGLSKLDGVNRLSKHNHKPSFAVDIAIYTKDSTYKRKILYDVRHLSYVAGVVQSCAKELFDKGEITHLVRWGGDWNSNGIISHDQSFQDLPHFELIDT